MTPSAAFPSRRFSALSGVLPWALLGLGVLATAAPATAQVYYSTARPVDEIAANYPFDIPLVRSRGAGDTAVLTSADLLAPHLGERPVVVMFWMTTCGPCRAELAELRRLLPEWRAAADFAFVPISLDFPRRGAAFHEMAATFPWPSYRDVDREFPRVMPGGLNGVPQVFVFDAEGRQVFHRRKYRAGDLAALGEVLGAGR